MAWTRIRPSYPGPVSISPSITSRLVAHTFRIGLDHSAALCENHFHAMYAGANQVMIPAIDFVRDPVEFWEILSGFRISYTFAPNFFIAIATRAIMEKTQSERDQLKLDFSHLRVIMCGGEANRTATIVAAETYLCQHGAPTCCVKASYGLTEVSYPS